MTEQSLSDHATATVHHESLLSRALGVIPYQPVNNTAHIFSFHTETQDTFHGFFVFHPLLLIFLNDDNKVVDTHVLQPFTTYKPTTTYKTVIELDPSNTTTPITPGDVIKIDV